MMSVNVAHLKSMRDFSKFSYRWLLVDELMPIKISKLGAIQTNTKVCAKDSFSFLKTQCHSIAILPLH